MSKKRAIFFDRDGTLIHAVHRPEFPKKITAPFSFNELRFISLGSAVLKRVKELGYLRIMITNQPDVAYGYMPEDEWERIQQCVTETLALDDVFMCRHRSEDKCPMKKPSSLMLVAAADKWGIDLSSSYMIGDTEKDIRAGKAAGCKTILVQRFYNTEFEKEADIVIPSLRHVLDVIA